MPLAYVMILTNYGVFETSWQLVVNPLKYGEHIKKALKALWLPNDIKSIKFEVHTQGNDGVSTGYEKIADATKLAE